MLIIYFSIGLIAISLIFLGIQAFKIFKQTKPIVDNMSRAAARIQEKTEKIKAQTNKLSHTQQEIMEDIDFKKQAINLPISEAKQTPALVRKVVAVKHDAFVERKRINK
ncbi:DUF948 domain-containing protein [Metabacillus arenae]|uniref:DUF948 domain-containing protein n=1 Tax=Metabacillus arenae TaxID=2771434 RepID=A0A926NDE7_9BACI|nr:DUF948 domain-containing protein [Metabacillus arenae]MBD1379479.1 DUF948 domain-containing protein [Metabacillus arenae]